MTNFISYVSCLQTAGFSYFAFRHVLHFYKMIVCCVPLCEKSGSRIFHSFPKNPKICQKWINKTKCFKLNKHSAYKTRVKVCKDHFRNEDFLFPGSRYLKKGSVPSLNLPEALNIVNEHSYCENDSVVS